MTNKRSETMSDDQIKNQIDQIRILRVPSLVTGDHERYLAYDHTLMELDQQLVRGISQ